MNMRDFAFLLSPDARLLVLASAEGYTLPTLDTEQHGWNDARPLQAFLRGLGLSSVILRALQADYQPDSTPAIQNIYALSYTGGSIPAGARWVSADDLPALNLNSPYPAETLSGWLNALTHAHPQRPQWSEVGWYAPFIAQIEANLSALGYTLTDTPEQVRVWERSMVVRLPTQQGNLYLKCVPPMFAHEPALTAWLSEHQPDISPRVVLHGEGYLVMREYTGQALMARPEYPIWEAAIRTYARLQRALIPQTEALRGLGVPLRDIDWLQAGIRDLLADDVTLKRGNRPLSEEEIARLRGLAPRFEAACDALRASPIPLGLEHGDLWTGQIIVTGAEGFCITDWSDSTLTCPFFSLPFFLAETANELPDPADAPARLQAVYLDTWTDIASIEALQGWYEHAALLSPMFTAVQYRQDVLPRMENQWEMENMLAYNLRLALRA